MVDSSQATGILASFLIAIMSIVPFALVFLFGDYTEIVNPLLGDLTLLAYFAAIVIGGLIIGAALGGYLGANSAKSGASMGVIAALTAFGFWIIGDLYLGLVSITLDLTSYMVFLYLIFLAVGVLVFTGVVYKLGSKALE